MRNASCPNCRGSAVMIAVWNFIGPRPDPSQGQPNLFLGSYDAAAEVTQLATPRSMATDYEFTTPLQDRVQTEPITPEAMAETNVARPALPDFPISAMNFDSASSFPTFPSSSQDANE